MQPQRLQKRQRCVTLIDLGELGAFDDAEPEPPRRPVPRWLRRLGVPERRKAASVAVLALLAGGLGGTGPKAAAEPPFRILPEVTVQAGLWVIGDTLLQMKGDGQIMTATDLITGATGWSLAIGQSVFGLQGADGVLAVQTGPAPGFDVAMPSQENMTRAIARGRLTVVDVSTGRQRWQHHGALQSPFTTERTLVFLVSSEDVDGSIGRWFLVGVDRHDGRDVWRELIPDATRWTFPRLRARPDTLDPTSFVMTAPDATVSIVDTATGRHQRVGRVPAGSTVEWSWQGLLGLHRLDPGLPPGVRDSPPPDSEVDIRARLYEVYDLTRLDTPLWSQPLPRGMEDQFPFPCEENILCRARDGDIERIGPRTGAPIAAADDFGEFYTPGALGLWRIGGQLYGTATVTETVGFVSPSVSRTDDGWLGLVRLRRPEPEIVPLIRIPLQLDSCWPSTDTWLVCSGNTGTIVMRQADFRALVAANRPEQAS